MQNANRLAPVQVAQRLTPVQVAQIRATTGCDHRTIRAYPSGRLTATSRARIEAAARELGITLPAEEPPPPPSQRPRRPPPRWLLDELRAISVAADPRQQLVALLEREAGR